MLLNEETKLFFAYKYVNNLYVIMILFVRYLVIFAVNTIQEEE